jgi:hypothetical protein
MGNSKFLLIVATDVQKEMEEEFNQWYDKEHIPGLLKVPGVLRAERYVSTSGSPKYFAIYEHEDESVQESEDYKKMVNTEWTKKIKPHLINFHRFFLKRI